MDLLLPIAQASQGITDTGITDAGKANAEGFLWYAFTQAAVYNAVVGITGTDWIKSIRRWMFSSMMPPK